ncbi:MAG TPA: DUF2235 domain-containing protein, partial [Opitutales bacterium]|nr:DUF2235 domain-containing protein [Opitutales bacterium]
TAFGGHHPSAITNVNSIFYQPMPTQAHIGSSWVTFPVATFDAQADFGAQEWTAGGANTDRFRKNTKEEDDDGLVNEGQRYFNPETNTFLTYDPAGTIDGLYEWGYVNQNPWTKFDPEGLAGYFFDGTSNYEGETENGKPATTNVRKMYEAYTDARYYYRGVGNPVEHGALARPIEQATGAGSEAIRDRAYQQLVKNYNAGDKTIDIVGFSRGAANAVEFAKMIYEKGIPDLSSARTVTKTMAVAGGKGEVTTTKTVYDKYLVAPESTAKTIRFIGLFDTVYAMGFPPSSPTSTSLPPNVANGAGYHAVSLDEQRTPFAQTNIPNANTAYFHGVHGDVGGGYSDSRLSDGPLQWMVGNAQVNGVKFSPMDLHPDPTAPAHDSSNVFMGSTPRTFPNQ